jgi:hypothetical protein
MSRDSPDSIEHALKNVFQATREEFDQEPEIIVVFLAKRDTQLYAEVKRVGDTVLGVPTQVILHQKIRAFRNPNQESQYWVNVTLKVRARLVALGPGVRGRGALSLYPWILFSCFYFLLSFSFFFWSRAAHSLASWHFQLNAKLLVSPQSQYPISFELQRAELHKTTTMLIGADVTYA